MLTFVVQSSFEARAEKVQLVHLDRNSPIGPIPTDVGPPKKLLLSNASVLLKNKTAMGLPTMDMDFFRGHPNAAFDIEPMESVIDLARIGCGLAIAVAGLGSVLLPRLKSGIPPSEP